MKKTKSIIIFEIYRLLMVLCSFIGINKLFISSNLYTNVRYIPRQAYYLVVLPALILMREEAYMMPLKKFINKYGNFLFWLVYDVQIFSNRKFCITVSTVLVLAGLALYNGGTRRTVRYMVKFLAIMSTPMAGGGN